MSVGPAVPSIALIRTKHEKASHHVKGSPLMPKQGVQLKQVSSPPINWLSEGKFKLSLLLRHEVARTGRASDAFKYLSQEKFSPERLLSAFPGLRKPDNGLIEKASDDYLRCILAKGIAEVYKKVTPKYRNEAARKQFFKKLVKIAEATYLSQSNQDLREFFEFSTNDDMTIWLNAELEHLISQKTDLATEFYSKLNNARNEFKSALRQLESITGVTWRDSERYIESLVVTSFFPPEVDESEETWRWGSEWRREAGILNINPPILFFETLRRGVLAREAAILLSPLNLDSMPDAPRVLCEQAEYLAYKLFDRKNDRELWAEARHGLRKQTRVFGHELLDFFNFYEMMVGDSLYREVWSRLKEFGSVHLAVSDYYSIFNTLAARPTYPKFDVQDKQLLALLSKRPDVKAGEAARVLHVSIPTAMKAIRDLSRRAGLRFNIIADLQKLGLVEYLVLINASKQPDVIRILSKFPYCRQVFRTYGSFDLFCVIDMPEEHREFAREFMDAMVARKLVAHYRLLELERDLQAVNFDRYDVERGRWDIHWDTWGISLRENMIGAESSVYEYWTSNRKMQLDNLDLSILLDLQLDCRTPFSALGRSLNVSGAYIGKKVTKMMRDKIFRFALWPLKIGAEDWGVIGLSCSKQVASTLASSLSLLPAWRGGLVKGDYEGIFAIVWCPNGELKQLLKTIDDRLIRGGYANAECLNSVGEWVVARWLPVDPDESTPWHLFNEGRWVFDKSRYMSLIG
jgi:DNA-binding Lrp family transcriptional regulator